jgi:hypothetical protein
MDILVKRAPAGVAQPAVAATAADMAEGKVSAIVATLDDTLPDHDGDIVSAKAVTDGTPVVLSSYQHDVVTRDLLPVGKGALYREGKHLVFRGHYFMDVQTARDAFHTLRQLGGQAQWSWAFYIQKHSEPTAAQRALGVKRVITMADAFEVSPVVRGAGRNTRTVSAKVDDERHAAAMLAERERFLNHIRHKHPQWPNESHEMHRRRLLALYFTAA